MNHSAIEQQSLSLTPEKEGLTTPHFDDSAVATAHQVEPLPKRPAYRFGPSGRVLTVALAIVVGIVLGISVAMFSLVPRGDNAAPPVLAEASAQMDSLDDSAARTSTIDSSVARDSSVSRQKSPRAARATARRTIDRYMAEEFGDDDDYSPKPAARRVGVIYSGRQRNNP